MFVIRRAKIEDVGTLLKLARMVHFINLPADRDIITAKVIHSRNCFQKVASGGPSEAQDQQEAARAARAAQGMAGLGASLLRSDLFMYVIEEAESGACLGTSQIVASMGGPGRGNVAFKLERRHLFSESLQTGTSHIVARMHIDESGPSEIGGLILQPSYRSHKRKLGRFLSLIRFHFVGLHRQLFNDRILAEMMAPITPDGQNLLWEYLGRRFVPLSYTEADRFCQYSREFVTSLLPKEDIYLSLLPPEARAVVGQVGPETVPARRMLEKLGFEYKDFIDPFDGGPHLEAETDEIPVVRDTVWSTIGEAVPAAECDRHGIISVLDPDGEFRAIDDRFGVDGQGRVCLMKDRLKLLRVSEGTRVGVTPTDGHGPIGSKAASDAAASGRRPRPTNKKPAGKKKTSRATK